MQEFLSQGWVGNIVGIVGLTLAVFFYWRSQIAGIIAIQSHDVSMLGGGTAVFPDGVEVRYRDTSVPRITSSTVWIWNAGRRTVEGSKIVPHDPLQLRYDGEILNVRIRKVTRDVPRFTARASEESEQMVRWGFDFLEPSDGFVFEVLHTGSVKAPECTGTVIGLPKGIQYRTRWGKTIPRGRIWILLGIPGILVFVAMLLVPLAMALQGILGIFGMSDQFEHPLRGALIFGFLSLFPIVMLWALREEWASLSSPPSLDL